MGILRLLLALSVIADHTSGFFGNHLVGGPTAVQSFYLISGFYMALVLNGKYNFAGSYWPFIIQRILRLYPLYILILISTLVWAWAGLHWTGTAHTNASNWFSQDLDPLAKTLLSVSQIVLIGQDAVSFFILTGTPLSLHYASHSLTAANPAWSYLLVPQAWSISVEILFYLLAPFLVRMSVKWQILFVAGTMAVRSAIYWGLGLNYDPWTHRFMPIELGIFALGSLAYQFYDRFQIQLRKRRELAFVALGLIVLLSLLYSNAEIAFKRPGFNVLILASLPSLFAVFQKNAIDSWIAELSYPVYMVHMLVIYVVHGWIERLPEGYQGVIYAVVSIVAAGLLYMFFMKPLELVRKWIFGREKKQARQAERETDVESVAPIANSVRESL